MKTVDCLLRCIVMEHSQVTGDWRMWEKIWVNILGKRPDFFSMTERETVIPDSKTTRVGKIVIPLTLHKSNISCSFL